MKPRRSHARDDGSRAATRHRPGARSLYRGALRALLGLGLALGLAATALGLLAPWWPELELINHFRPVLALGALALLALAAVDRGRGAMGAAAALALVNLALAALPFAYRAEAAQPTRDPLKIVTLNLWAVNGDLQSIARFLEAEKADVVVLQEANRIKGALLTRLKAAYPHATCPDATCSQAILSRTAPLATGQEDVPPRHPLLVWARFDHGGRPVTVMGLHLAYPFEPQAQVAHVDWLIDYLRQQPGPIILAGDLNLTPFSWKFVKLLHATGFRAHLVDRFTWPAHRFVPIVQLDNVLTTPDLARISTRVGPSAGSDHRSVIAEVGWR